MILVDTSVWVDYLRAGNPELADALNAGRVCIHDAVIGELACGNLVNRQSVLGLLQSLPRLSPGTDDEVLFFIERRQLMGRGIGYIDAQLLASSVMHHTLLWTRDKRLHAIAAELGVAHFSANQ